MKTLEATLSFIISNKILYYIQYNSETIEKGEERFFLVNTKTKRIWNGNGFQNPIQKPRTKWRATHLLDWATSSLTPTELVTAFIKSKSWRNKRGFFSTPDASLDNISIYKVSIRAEENKRPFKIITTVEEYQKLEISRIKELAVLLEL